VFFMWSNLAVALDFFCFHYETAKPILNLVSSVCTETASTGGPIDHLCC
jgi:hypothetical protein